jgi:hypothetical protein
MSRGPGVWQRSLLSVTSDGLLATTRAIMLGSVTRPTRSDNVCIRRAAKSLALAGRIQAAYVHACAECGAIRREGRTACCASVRPMLAVAPAGSRLRYLAPPPVRPVPSWICAALPVHPLGPRYEVASVAGVLDLMIQRGMERVRSGEAKVGVTDLLAALRLRCQIEAASQPDDSRWEQFTVALLDELRGWLGPGQFGDFIGAVRSSPAFGALAT